MADPDCYGNHTREIEQALIALKKGTQLIKYCRKRKPKFRTFRLSTDETKLIWYSHGAERHLKLSSVKRIIPGQRTPVFKRFLRPEKEYLSFSLIYDNGERSLDLICKDKNETEVWLVGLRALTSVGQAYSRRIGSEVPDFYGGGDLSRDNRPSGARLELSSSISYDRVSTSSSFREYYLNRSSSRVGSECASMQIRTSNADGFRISAEGFRFSAEGFRISVSSTPSCSSHGSGADDIESLGDIYVWGGIWSDGIADGTGNAIPIKNDVLIPTILESNVVLDVQQISCGVRHIALVTRQGEVFTWGEESGGRLGHGIERDFSRPKLVEFLTITKIEFVACGEFHTCALSTSGALYTWGDGAHNAGLLGHGNDVSHWIPKIVFGSLEGLHVLSVACGTWHSAVITSTGHLFTFGEGAFGALGHGDHESIPYPKEVQSLSGLKTVAVSCGLWHTAAIAEVINHTGESHSSRKLFTWGDGDKNRLGHGDKKSCLVPTCVSSLIEYSIQQLACGHNITVALTSSGHVFTMGSNAYGQLGDPLSDGKWPRVVKDGLMGEFVEQISCGTHHVAVLTSRNEVYTWGKGANGRLGHGSLEDHNIPKLVEALRERHVKNIVCGSNYTASICLHKWVSGADQSVCTACRQSFGFTRKRHNCYNCGNVHCHACSSKKSLRAALAPVPGKPHRVCDSCYLKLKRAADAGNAPTLTRRQLGARRSIDEGEGRTSRLLLTPIVEPIKYHEVKSRMPGKTYDDFSMVRASQVPAVSLLKDIAFPSSLSGLQSSLKPVITSATSSPPAQHQSQSYSSPSTYSQRPSPPRSGTPVFSRFAIDSLKKTNDVLTQELSKLRGQAESLKQKTDVQDKEIQKLKTGAQEATSLAADRSSKCITALQAVKTIIDQLTDIKEKLPPEISESESFKMMHAQVESLLDTTEDQASEGSLALPPDEQQNHPDKTELASESNSKEHHPDRLNQSRPEGGPGTPEAAKTEERREVMEQFEPGVYVTLLLLPNGTKFFKRIRFSKRRFTELQAEEWWKENKERLLRKYSPGKTTNRSVDATAAQPPAEVSNGTKQSL
ncbi:hypothetical protein ACS0TY_036472 [Phlomoides rotata]